MIVQRIVDKIRGKKYVLYRIRYKSANGYWYTFLLKKKQK